MIYQALVQINMNLMRILTILMEFKKTGVPVTTQESHTPG